MEPRARLWGVGGGSPRQGGRGTHGEGQTDTTSYALDETVCPYENSRRRGPPASSSASPSSARTLLSGLFDNKSATIVIPASLSTLTRTVSPRSRSKVSIPPSWTLSCAFPPRPPRRLLRECTRRRILAERFLEAFVFHPGMRGSSRSSRAPRPRSTRTSRSDSSTGRSRPVEPVRAVWRRAHPGSTPKSRR